VKQQEISVVIVEQNLINMDEILKYDSNFSENKFKSFVDNVFIQIHLAIMTGEIEKIRHFVSNDIYDEITSKVKSLKEKGLIQMYDEINVKQTTLLKSEIKDNCMIINVNITSRYMDYLMDKDGNFVSGIKNDRVQKENYLKFKKNLDFSEQSNARKCPGCGANIDVNANGLCSYCGTTYNLEDKDWILISLEVV
jgi:predicted lipid-binding transport protein (Tim44 family)